MLARVFGGRGAVQPIQYETARDLAQDPDPKIRADLASRTDTQPEVLYFLAGDTQPEVRLAVAANPAAPGHADVLLAGDDNEEVRGELARKIGRLLPNLGPDKAARLRDMTLSTLHSLAQDQVPRVRAMLAEELKSRADAPRDVVLRLAHDLAAMVAAPILEYSPLLSDADLMEIIAKGQLQERLSAIARRQNVSEAVSDAIVATLDVPAVASLLANPSAQIREETLDLIVERAPAQPSWHAPLVERPALPARAIRKISSFIADALLKVLERRPDLDTETRTALAGAVRQRREAAEAKPEAKPAETPKPAEAPKPAAGPAAIEEEVRRLAKAGQLDEEAVSDRLLVGDRLFVRLALAELAKVKPDVVDRILLARSPKGVVSLAWRAGVGMRCAVQLQMRMGGIAPKQLLQPRAGAWPLTPQEMSWHLEFFGAA